MNFHTENYPQSDTRYRLSYPNSALPFYPNLHSEVDPNLNLNLNLNLNFSNDHYQHSHPHSYYRTHPSSNSISTNASVSSASSGSSVELFPSALATPSNHPFSSHLPMNTPSVSEIPFFEPKIIDNNDITGNNTDSRIPADQFEKFENRRLALLNRHKDRKTKKCRDVPSATTASDGSTHKRKYYFKNHQSKISDSFYMPADKEADICKFTKEDIIILKNILPAAEIHKWKHISNSLSKSKSKKLNAQYCIQKFHDMFNLPLNPQHTPLHASYCLSLNQDSHQLQGKNYEGMVGSSIGYILSKDGWNYID
ncbi:hypothetical protein DAMA08_050150 [Martiniozyma asiatica (nom. inval.)]|nr:hypothetical protein DAMA08_050150 [Martiniozyma asiatica]